jgi:hypothetical protein
MLQDLNPTTRCYPRTENEAFNFRNAIEGPYTPEPTSSIDAEFWVQITLAFAAGFLACHLWG